MRNLGRSLAHISLSAAAVLSFGLATAPAQATNNPTTVEASGTFIFTTSPGIMPTWNSAGISLVGISPGSVITTTAGLNARITLPVVAKTGTANATAGGFRFLNSATGQTVRCQVPTVDTRARQVDCVFTDGTSRTLFVITDIADRFKVTDARSITTFFRGMDLSFVDSSSAASLNTALSTNVFSASVSVARGVLEVSRSR
jgi:hypothetical protein